MDAARPTLTCGDLRLALGTRTFVMGVLNVTPDSFSDGGQVTDLDAAVARAEAMLHAGADIIDVGGESTRPGADPVDVTEELERVAPVIAALAQRGIRNVSVDTRRARVARAALDAGASWLNDVSALSFDPQMRALAGAFDVVVLMHAKGLPKNMQSSRIHYTDVVAEVRDELDRALSSAALDPGRVVVDPGIGFGKRLQHNLALSRSLNEVRGRAAGILYGPSRKAFLGELTKIAQPSARDPATHAAVALGVASGADIVRVHAVAGALQASRLADGWSRGSAPS